MAFDYLEEEGEKKKMASWQYTMADLRNFM